MILNDTTHMALENVVITTAVVELPRQLEIWSVAEVPGRVSCGAMRQVMGWLSGDGSVAIRQIGGGDGGGLEVGWSGFSPIEMPPNYAH